MSVMQTERENAVILIDGECNLCNRFVRFIFKRDRHARFRFAALQSEAGRSLLQGRADAPAELSTVAVLEGGAGEGEGEGTLYLRSTAALRIVRHLRQPWPLLYAFVLIPRFVRDPIYNWVARHRYAWFGRRDMCELPPPDLHSRFLDGGLDP